MLSRPQQLVRAIARQQPCRRARVASAYALARTPQWPLLNTSPPQRSLATTTTTSSSPSSPNSWSTPGPAATDFRSDVVTTPTASMLTAIAHTTLLDDVFREDPTTTSLESRLASLTSHEAGLFVLSGTMGNQLALRAHLAGPPHAILCDHRAHILEWEAGGAASLCGALIKGVVPRNGRYMTLEDVQENIVLADDVHACPTRVIALENTLGGSIMPLTEMRRIAAFAREQGVKVHLDGARLWEAVAAGTGTLEEFAGGVDSVSLCFSKGLGAPVGSVLVGSEEVIKRARWVRKSIGGGVRQMGVLAAAAGVAVEETFLGGRLKGAQEMARRVGGVWEGLGGRLEREVETNMVWLDLEAAGVSEEVFVEVGRRKGVKVAGGRLVVHYQISEEAVERLGEAMEEVLGLGARGEGRREKRVGFKSYG